MHLIIDGYNLIRQVHDLARYERESMERAREVLIEKLALYRKIKRHKVTVVFDGVLNMSESPSTYKQAGVAVCFSSDVEKADDVIKRMVNQQTQAVTVVTSDRDILNHAEKQGAATIYSPQFYERLSLAVMMGMDAKPDDDDEEVTHKRWTTKKRGPSKRLPKKKRQNKNRLKKL
jgi:uncharacterized protein